MARKRRKARSAKRRRSHKRRAAPCRRRRAAASAAPRRSRRRRSNPRRRARARSAMRSHSVRYMNPKRRHKRRSHGRRRNPLGLTGVHGWKNAIPVVLGGAVAGAALYAGNRVIMKYPQSSPKMTAAVVGGVGLVGGIAAALLAGPVAGAIVAATMATMAISTVLDTPSVPGPVQGLVTMKPNILPMRGVLADNLGKLKPFGAVMADNLGAYGAGSLYRKNESKDVSDLVRKLGPRV